VEAEFTTGSTEVQVRLSSAGQQIGGVYQAVIIATGTARRMLGVPGEAEAQGRGIALSGRKDLERFRAQRVVVVGSGDAAFENASLIAPVANSVTLVCRTSEHHARPEFQRGAVAMPNVEILSKTVMTAVESDEGTGRLRAVVLESDGRAWRLEADVALIRIGVDARVPKATIDGQPAPSAEGGFLAANERRQVGHPRLLAVGDCARPGLRAIAMAAADGATAAHTVAELFSGRDPKT
jgi:thioredoxin reductase (NADPH)